MELIREVRKPISYFNDELKHPEKFYNEERMKKLIDNCNNIDYRYIICGCSCFNFACSQGRINLVFKLLKKGCRTDIKCTYNLDKTTKKEIYMNNIKLILLVMNYTNNVFNTHISKILYKCKCLKYYYLKQLKNN